MSKQAILSLAVTFEGNQELLSLEEDKAGACSEVEQLYIFRDSVVQLKKKIHHLSFMMSEIQDVLETSAGARRFSI